MLLRPVCKVDAEAPEHQAEEKANTARQTQDQPGVERDDDAGASPGAADRVRLILRGAKSNQSRHVAHARAMPARPRRLRRRPSTLATDVG